MGKLVYRNGKGVVMSDLRSEMFSKLYVKWLSRDGERPSVQDIVDLYIHNGMRWTEFLDALQDEYVIDVENMPVRLVNRSENENLTMSVIGLFRGTGYEGKIA